MKQIPVYKYPASQAAGNNELDQYRASRKANIACKEAIEAAIREHYRDNRLGRKLSIRCWKSSEWNA